jgi:hypothetical protein
MRLVPKGDRFRQCYGQWTADIARMIVNSSPGLSFGLYGRWGAGKSSACQALERKIYEVARDAGGNGVDPPTFQCVHVDVFRLRLLPPEGQGDAWRAAVREAIRFEEQPRWDWRKICGAIRFVAPLLPKGGGQMRALADAAEELAVKRNSDLVRANRDPATAVDRLVVFLDDLDRCDPKEAIAVLSNVGSSIFADADAADSNPSSLVPTVIVVCDPDVLAAHVAQACGVAKRAGLDVVSKYIHVPLMLPTGLTRGHVDLLPTLMPRFLSEGLRTLFASAALKAVGFIPIREILAALPQGAVWAMALGSELEQAQERANLCCSLLYFSILANAVPELGRVLSRTPHAFIPLHDLLMPGPKHPTDLGNLQDALGRQIVEILAERGDLLHLGRDVMNVSLSDSWRQRIAAIIASHSSPLDRS